MKAAEKNELFRLLDWIYEHPLKSGRRISVCLWGHAGVGKTTMLREWAERHRQMTSITYQPSHDRSGADLRGMPWVDESSRRTHYAPPASLPLPDENDTAFFADGVLIIDEANRAPREVRNGMLELIGEGAISQSGYQLPDTWQVIATANLEDSIYDVLPMEPAMKDRMLHLIVNFDPNRFANWAEENGLEPDIIEFARRHAELISGSDTDLVPDLGLTTSSRSLEMMASLWDPQAPRELMQTLAYGVMGKEVADLFLSEAGGSVPVLSAEQILAGMWRRYVERWQEPAHVKSANETIVNLARHMSTHDPSWSQAEQVLDLLGKLGSEQRMLLLKAMSAHARNWVELIKQTHPDELEKLVRQGVHE